MRKKELNKTGEREAKEKLPVALVCADLHLSLKRPACRMDHDWMALQAAYLLQLKRMARAMNVRYISSVPILCAGDIFDHWNTPPELINFALEHLPDGMICVPGQHDLPNHRMDEVGRSGYGVLVQTEKIIDASGVRRRNVPSRSGVSLPDGSIVLGFGWNEQIEHAGLASANKGLRIALIHKYVWTINAAYPGAPEESHLSAVMEQLKGYDVAVFGDNHISFEKKLKTGTVAWNCGGFIRRRSDERERKPRLGVIFSDGSVEERLLNTAGDSFTEHPEALAQEAGHSMRQFLDQLESLGEHATDFRQTVTEFLASSENKVSSSVRDIVLSALDASKR